MKIIETLLSRWFVPRRKLEEANRLSVDLAIRLDATEDALRSAFGLIVQHHDCSVVQKLGAFCPLCRRPDGSEPEHDQIKAILFPRGNPG